MSDENAEVEEEVGRLRREVERETCKFLDAEKRFFEQYDKKGSLKSYLSSALLRSLDAAGKGAAAVGRAFSSLAKKV